MTLLDSIRTSAATSGIVASMNRATDTTTISDGNFLSRAVAWLKNYGDDAKATKEEFVSSVRRELNVSADTVKKLKAAIDFESGKPLDLAKAKTMLSKLDGTYVKTPSDNLREVKAAAKEFTGRGQHAITSRLGDVAKRALEMEPKLDRALEKMLNWEGVAPADRQKAKVDLLEGLFTEKMKDKFGERLVAASQRGAHPVQLNGTDGRPPTINGTTVDEVGAEVLLKSIAGKIDRMTTPYSSAMDGTLGVLDAATRMRALLTT